MKFCQNIIGHIMIGGLCGYDCIKKRGQGIHTARGAGVDNGGDVKPVNQKLGRNGGVYLAYDAAIKDHRRESAAALIKCQHGLFRCFTVQNMG